MGVGWGKRVIVAGLVLNMLIVVKCLLSRKFHV